MGLFFPFGLSPLSESDRVALKAPFMNEDVKQALFAMHPYKALSPDGFHVAFYQKSWEVVGTRVLFCP